MKQNWTIDESKLEYEKVKSKTMQIPSKEVNPDKKYR